MGAVRRGRGRRARPSLPGHRPSLWWRHSAPESERRKVGGTGEASGSISARGVSAYDGEDPYDPAMVESERAYLERHGLLLPGASDSG